MLIFIFFLSIPFLYLFDILLWQQFNFIISMRKKDDLSYKDMDKKMYDRKTSILRLIILFFSEIFYLSSQNDGRLDITATILIAISLFCYVYFFTSQYIRSYEHYKSSSIEK